ncbi:MAG: hypothetical protein Q9M24_09260 [Mariprofundaceae bacterium]|nr:hypothetical protein [Mariprofundaceae bacterium]
MSIIQDLYNIFDKEYAKHISRKSSKNLVVIEISQNLSFIREGLVSDIKASNIIKDLDTAQYKKATAEGVNLNSIQKKRLIKKTYGGAKEFEKYHNWTTEKLINKAYERIDTLKKLNINKENMNINSKLQYLFKFLMVLMAHIEEKHLTISSSGRKKHAA